MKLFIILVAFLPLTVKASVKVGDFVIYKESVTGVAPPTIVAYRKDVTDMDSQYITLKYTTSWSDGRVESHETTTSLAAFNEIQNEALAYLTNCKSIVGENQESKQIITLPFGQVETCQVTQSVQGFTTSTWYADVPFGIAMVSLKFGQVALILSLAEIGNTSK